MCFIFHMLSVFTTRAEAELRSLKNNDDEDQKQCQYGDYYSVGHFAKHRVSLANF